MTGRVRRVVLGLLVLHATRTVCPALDVSMPGIDPDSGVEIRLSSAFDELPPGGAVPIRLMIRNLRNKPVSLDFSFNSFASHTRMQWKQVVRMEPESQREVEYQIPLATPGLSRLEILCTAHALRGMFSWGCTIRAHGTGHTIAYPRSLATYIPPGLHGSQYELSRLPEEPSGWSGWDTVWMEKADWQGLPSGPRRALSGWVKTGGRLFILDRKTNTTLAGVESTCAACINSTCEDPWHSLREAKDVKRSGYGSISLVSADGPAITPLIQQALRAPSPPPNFFYGTDMHGRQMPPGFKLTAPDQNPVLIWTIVMLALLIGPANLMFVRGRGKMMYLFLTTPLLSTGATLVIGMTILFADGIGGKGVRFTSVFLDSLEHKAYIEQQQISLTGLLFGSAFTPSVPCDMVAIGTPANLIPSKDAAKMVYENGVWSGDWFSPRRVQTHLLHAVADTRMRVRVEEREGSAPQVMSEIQAPVERLFYVDQNRNIWISNQLVPGARTEMTRTTSQELLNWIDSRTGLEPSFAKSLARMRSYASEPGFFFADVSGASPDIIETLPSIRWKQKHLIYHGRVEALRQS